LDIELAVMWWKYINPTSPGYEKKMWYCSKEVEAGGLSRPNSQSIPPKSSSSLPDTVIFQLIVYSHRGHNEVRWRPGQEIRWHPGKFGTPMVESTVFRKQMYCNQESACDNVELFGAPAVIQRPGNCVPLPHLVMSLTTTKFPQTRLKSPPMLLIWRWICFYPGQQTQVRISL